MTTPASVWLGGITPARVFTGRAGSSYPTATLLSLRADHAVARDAVLARLDLDRPDLTDLVERYSFVAAETRAESRQQYLRRPDLGRYLSAASRAQVAELCPPEADLQFAIGDGLSVTAVHRQVPGLLPLLLDGCAARGWSVGRPIVIRQCRVGVLNDLGDVLRPTVVILLIGERPGLATAESLSAYFAYRPRRGHTDADRNLISNIHEHGIPTGDAAARILALAETLMLAGRSGISIKEGGPALSQ